MLLQAKDNKKSMKYLNGALSTRNRETKQNLFNEEGGVHMYSPQVESSINTYFQSQQRQDIDLRLKHELLAEEQERAIEYLKSGPY